MRFLMLALAFLASTSAFAQAHVRNTPPADALAGDTFYVTFFAYQRANNVLDRESSHTMALFTRVSSGFGAPQAVENVTISWMPASGVVRAFGPTETGALTDLNFELRRGGQPRNSRGFAWGPYRIPEVLFNRAVTQRDLLQSGSILYKAAGRDPISERLDYIGNRSLSLPTFLNCLAAVGDILPGGVTVGASSGQVGTRAIVTRYSPLFINENRTGIVDRHQWLSRQLNLAAWNALFPRGLELEEVRAPR